MNHKSIILKKLLIFLVVIYLLDFSLGALMKKFYFSQKSGWDYRTTYMIDSVKSDVLILGSSRASHHYNPKIIEDSLKLSTYNGGKDGCGIFYYYGVLKSALTRYRPKVVVLDIRPFEFEKEQDDYDRLNILLPYYGSNPELRPICLLRSNFEYYKLISKIYPYNSKLLPLITTAFHLKHTVNESSAKGYLGLEKEYEGSKPSEKFKNDLDTTKVACFRRFIADCHLTNVKLVVTISPWYVQSTNKSESIRMAKRLCEVNKVPFYDYSRDPEFDKHQLFADSYHMNKIGSALFTKIFVRHIRDDINGNDLLRQTKLAVKRIPRPAKSTNLHM